MTPTQLTGFWDALMTTLEAKLAGHPMLLGFVKIAQGIGDQAIPSIAASIPAGLNPAALVDALFTKIEANVTNPMELIALKTVNGLIDAYLGSLTLPPVPTA